MSNDKLKSDSHKMDLSSNHEAGQAVLIAVILSVAVSMLILFGLSLPIADQISNANDYLLSKQTLINSMTLDEEVLYRLNKSLVVPSVLGMSILSDTTSANISDVDPGAKQVLSNSVYNLFTRKTKAVISSNRDISFNYGAWLSSGGLRMDNSSKINGDVFSVGNTLLLNTSTVSGALSTSTKPTNAPLSDDDINNWKNQASTGDVITGDVTISNDSTTTVRSLKIIGNLTLKNDSLLSLGGSLYVTGKLTLDNSSRLQLISTYGVKSETVVVDGQIDLQNTAYLGGSGVSGSNIILATQNTSGCANTSCTGTTPAISISNSAMANAILVAPHGAVYLSNSSFTKGVFANYLYMSNSSSISPDSSLIDVNFNSSTSTYWGISSINEI